MHSEHGPPAAPRFLTLSEAAEYLGATERQTRRWVNEGKLPHYRPGGLYLRFAVEDLDAFLAASYTAARTGPLVSGSGLWDKQSRVIGREEDVELSDGVARSSGAEG
jgi:excisionase family DNA binding protein